MTIHDLRRRSLQNGTIHWELQISEPFEARNGAHTIHNVSLDVMTTTAGRAIELALAAHPCATIHVVQRRGVSNLLGDCRIEKELIEE